MPFKASNPMPVTVTTRPALVEPATPVYVVSTPPPVAGRARRVVQVTGGAVKGDAPIPVYNAGADALFTDDPPLPIYVVGGSLGAAQSSLIGGLAAYCKLDEASGTRTDALGANDLTDNNTVTQAAGKVSSAALFTAANSESLSHGSNATFQTGNISWAFDCWVFPTGVVGTQPLITKDDVSSQREYSLFLTNASVRWIIFDGGGSVIGDVTVAAALSAATWYYIYADVDLANSLIHLSINNGASSGSAALTGVPGTNAAPFKLGNDSTRYYGGRMDEVGFWKGRVLTATERATRYNSGNGNTYPF